MGGGRSQTLGHGSGVLIQDNTDKLHSEHGTRTAFTIQSTISYIALHTVGIPLQWPRLLLVSVLNPS